MIICYHKSEFDEEFYSRGPTVEDAFEEMQGNCWPAPKMHQCVFYRATKLKMAIKVIVRKR